VEFGGCELPEAMLFTKLPEENIVDRFPNQKFDV
jgi:hypothetical protein